MLSTGVLLLFLVVMYGVDSSAEQTKAYFRGDFTGIGTNENSTTCKVQQKKPNSLNDDMK